MTLDPASVRRRPVDAASAVAGEGRYFVFYEVDESLGEVRVLRVWHMSRGETPK